MFPFGIKEKRGYYSSKSFKPRIKVRQEISDTGCSLNLFWCVIDHNNHSASDEELEYFIDLLGGVFYETKNQSQAEKIH